MTKIQLLIWTTVLVTVWALILDMFAYYRDLSGCGLVEIPFCEIPLDYGSLVMAAGYTLWL